MQKNDETGYIQPIKLSGIKIGPIKEEALRNQLQTSVNLWSSRYRGSIAVFTYVCGTTEVHKQGTPEVHFTSWKCISYVHGTLTV